jgi:hypothetical protein
MGMRDAVRMVMHKTAGFTAGAPDVRAGTALRRLAGGIITHGGQV